MKNSSNILISLFILFFISSCAPSLGLTEIKDLIDNDLDAVSNNDIEYILNNVPVKYWESHSIEIEREYLESILSEDKSTVYSNISNLNVREKIKCKSFNFYLVSFSIQGATMTKYIDSTHVNSLYEEYGKRNVNYNPYSNILTIVEDRNKLVLYDKDKKWKIYNISVEHEEFIEEYFTKGLWNCLKSNL